MASVLALAAAVVCRFCRKPAVAHALWLLVLLKLIVPPLWKVPVYDAFSRLIPTTTKAPALEHVPVYVAADSTLHTPRPDVPAQLQRVTPSGGNENHALQ